MKNWIIFFRFLLVPIILMNSLLSFSIRVHFPFFNYFCNYFFIYIPYLLSFSYTTIYYIVSLFLFWMIQDYIHISLLIKLLSTSLWSYYTQIYLLPLKFYLGIRMFFFCLPIFYNYQYVFLFSFCPSSIHIFVNCFLINWDICTCKHEAICFYWYI